MNRLPKPIVLIILDGWGHRDSREHNPLKTVSTPTFDHLFAHYPHTLLQASGTAVGLPDNQMGNSEVGHLHIGSGRKVPQDLTRIRQDIQSGAFKQNAVLLQAIKTAKEKNSAVHILGLVSPGGVHSHENQIRAAIEMVGEAGITKNYLHAILDGRDTPPQSAKVSLEKFIALYQTLPGGQIASIVGRYYAMDRDRRFERTQQAYELITEGRAAFHASNPLEALQLAYDRKETDEFVKPTCIHSQKQAPIYIQDNDVVIFMNFRADRARQLSHALTDQSFKSFPRNKNPHLSAFITLTQYAKDISAQVAYPTPKLHNTLGEFLANQNYKQLRIAETEKYAHVTYFLNGGIETPFPHEDRILIPSPKVATYDLQPQMSAYELTEQLVSTIEGGHYDVILCNFANPDMVGHTGVYAAAEKAISVIDSCIARILEALQKVGGEALITADHGNIETMYDEKTGQPHTAHTSNLVPLIYVGRPAQFCIEDGALDDIAPTLLALMNLTPPTDMTGRCLLRLKKKHDA